MKGLDHSTCLLDRRRIILSVIEHQTKLLVFVELDSKRFHRASNFDRSISGLGIGLYLVNEIVTRHGGRVWVESVEGCGSTIYVLLPPNNNSTQ